jgi:hypothetical protein
MGVGLAERCEGHWVCRTLRGVSGLQGFSWASVLQGLGLVRGVGLCDWHWACRGLCTSSGLLGFARGVVGLARFCKGLQSCRAPLELVLQLHGQSTERNDERAWPFLSEAATPGAAVVPPRCPRTAPVSWASTTSATRLATRPLSETHFFRHAGYADGLMLGTHSPRRSCTLGIFATVFAQRAAISTRCGARVWMLRARCYAKRRRQRWRVYAPRRDPSGLFHHGCVKLFLAAVGVSIHAGAERPIALAGGRPRSDLTVRLRETAHDRGGSAPSGRGHHSP